MTLFDRIERDAYTLSDKEECKTGRPPKVVCYLGMNQKHELLRDFNNQPHIVLRKFGEPWSGDPQIGGCQIFYVFKDDHYNVTLLNS